MLLQLEVNDSQSKFFLDLLSNLSTTVKKVTFLDDNPLEESHRLHREYFEITGLDGIEYKVPNWSEEEFKEFALRALYDEDESTEVEFE